MSQTIILQDKWEQKYSTKGLSENMILPGIEGRNRTWDSRFHVWRLKPLGYAYRIIYVKNVMTSAL